MSGTRATNTVLAICCSNRTNAVERKKKTVKMYSSYTNATRVYGRRSQKYNNYDTCFARTTRFLTVVRVRKSSDFTRFISWSSTNLTVSRTSIGEVLVTRTELSGPTLKTLCFKPILYRVTCMCNIMNCRQEVKCFEKFLG